MEEESNDALNAPLLSEPDAERVQAANSVISLKADLSFMLSWAIKCKEGLTFYAEPAS